jgi:ABC-type branched-subunit amino acid transport system substrate-binding protein
MVFRAFPTPDAELAALVGRARARGARRFAVIGPTSGFGDAMRAAFGRAVTTQGGELVASPTYAPGATSFGREATALRAAAPDAVFVADAARTLALVAPALAAAGLGCQPAGAPQPRDGRAFVLLATGIGFDPALARSSSRHLQGALFSVPFHVATATGAARTFAERFTAQQLGGEPDAFAAFAHDAYRIVRSTVDAGARTRPDLALRLAGSRADTASALGGFTAAREPQRATRLLELRGDAFVAGE